MMSLGFETGPLKNPNDCTTPYTPTFYLGKPGALTAIRMPAAGYNRGLSDGFAVHDLLDGQAVDRSPYQSRTWAFQHQWLKPDAMSTLMEFVTRQRGVGPFILVDPQAKNLLTPNQASGTDALRSSDGFRADQTSTTAFFDFFEGTTSNGWGVSTSGHTWTIDGTASQFAEGSGVGTHSVNALNTVFRSRVAGLSIADVVFRFVALVNVAPTGSYIRTEVEVRLQDLNNMYGLQIHRQPGGAIDLQLFRTLGGVTTGLGALTSTVTHTAGISILGEIRMIGTTLSAKIWRADQNEPSTFEITANDPGTTITAGSVGIASLLPPGNSNTLPVTMTYDNLVAYNLGIVNTIVTNTADSVQGEASVNWTLSPPVTGTSSVLHIVSPTGLYGFCLPPSKIVAFSGWVKLGSASLDPSVQITPQLVFMNGSGAVQSTVSGAPITAVTGTAGSGWQAFCVTGSVPAGQAGVYLDPTITALNSTINQTTSILIDQLQLELTPTGTCTQWEYGQGQPLVSVRSDGESVPRILRTDLGFVAVEVT
jgi:hypothetical protein